jgi:hypothetical protein
MGIEGEIRNELTRLNVPVTSLRGFWLDQSQDPNVSVIRIDYEGVTGTFDPEDLLSLLKKLPDQAGSIVVTEAIRISSERR